MINIHEVDNEHPQKIKTDEQPQLFAILVDHQKERLLVASYNDMFQLIDLILNDTRLEKTTVYRTQSHQPTVEQLKEISNTIFE